ncbi:MAG TPA: peptidase M10 [Anaeromyxobacter sp.]
MSLRAVLAAVALLAGAPAAAYVRTTAKGTGVPLAWPVPVVPWDLNPAWANTAPSCTAGAVHGAVQASFAEWEQGCANLRLLYAGDSAEQGTGVNSSGRNVVMFRNGWCSQDPRVVDPTTGHVDPCMNDPDLTCGDLYGCFQDPATCIGKTSCASWNVLALTTVLHDPSSGRILSADIELVGWDGGAQGSLLTALPPHGWYFTCNSSAQTGSLCTRYGDGGCDFIDLQNTVTHEAGHFLGLAHPCGEGVLPACPTPSPTMAPTAPTGQKTKRVLTADDVAGVCAIYPEPSGGCGCGGGGGTGTAALLLVALALRRSRLRENWTG